MIIRRGVAFIRSCTFIHPPSELCAGGICDIESYPQGTIVLEGETAWSGEGCCPRAERVLPRGDLGAGLWRTNGSLPGEEDSVCLQRGTG